MKILISLVFIFLSPTQFSVLADEELIETACKKTPYYDLCVSSLKSDTRSGSADVRGLAQITVDLILAKTIKAEMQIKKLLDSTTDPEMQKSLKQCAVRYYAVHYGDIPQANEALTKGNYKFAEQAANDAAIEAEFCEKGFSSSPITYINKNIHDLSVITASIVRILLLAAAG